MVQVTQQKTSTGSATLRELVEAKERLGAATQKQKVLAHLLTLGKISPLEAFGVYGIFRLASCIYDLKKDGFEIQTILKRDLNNKPYAVYKLKSYGSIPQQKSRHHRLGQMPITDYVVLEEGTFTEKLLKALREKTSELEKLKEKDND